jgi:signal peptidase I
MNNKVKKALLWLLDLAINVAIIFGLVLIIQRWFIAPFDVSGASMCDTLNYLEGECINDYGEKIIINEATYLFNDPERGEIVVFTTGKSDDKYYIKRIIGLPGEIIELKDGEVFLTPVDSNKSIKIEEPYLNSRNKGHTEAHLGVNVFEIPEEHYFLMGDNRLTSTDSRSCFNSLTSQSCKSTLQEAFIHEDLIRGKAWVVWWPLSSIRIIDTPTYELISSSIQTDSESLEEK